MIGFSTPGPIASRDAVLDRRGVDRREGPAAQILRLQRVRAGGEAGQPELDLAGDALDAQRALIDHLAVPATKATCPWMARPSPLTSAISTTPSPNVDTLDDSRSITWGVPCRPSAGGVGGAGGS